MAVLSLPLVGSCAVDPPPAPQSTETTTVMPPPKPKATQIIMAIDNIGPGFNPHLLSDQSPVTAAISSLVLPSAFRPVPDAESATGSRWEMDPTLLVSAEVTNDDPFTVTYKIRPEASWTDNAPIAADDFWYLWRQMVAHPGVVDPAGYDLITGVQSIDGGKTAVVTFSQPYPAWRELFADLLPQHIVKDIPGGFGAGLARVLPVTGGSSGWRPSTRSATRSCWPATTGFGAPRRSRTCCCSGGRDRLPHLLIRSASATPRWRRCTVGRRPSRSFRRSPMCEPTGS